MKQIGLEFVSHKVVVLGIIAVAAQGLDNQLSVVVGNALIPEPIADLSILRILEVLGMHRLFDHRGRRADREPIPFPRDPRSNVRMNPPSSAAPYQFTWTITDPAGANVTIQNIGPPGSMSNVGGLVGSNWSQLSVVSSYAKGAISAATDNAGGLIGSGGHQLIVSASASSVSVIAQGTSAGGLVGTASGVTGFDGAVVINNSLATGRVWGGAPHQGGSNAGGLIGTSLLVLVENSVATGNVSGLSNVGGFVGLDNGFNQIYNCSSQGAATASTGPVGALGGAKTQFDSHNLDGLYTGNTWSKSANSGLGGNLFGVSLTPIFAISPNS